MTVPEPPAITPVSFVIEPVEAAGQSSWWDRAICKGYPHKRGEPDPFDKSKDDPGYTVAKSFCAMCPVKDECLDDAMEEEGWKAANFRSTVRGGLTPPERYRLKHRMAEQARRQESEAA